MVLWPTLSFLAAWLNLINFSSAILKYACFLNL
jgi:hypothetical protein